MGSKLEYSLKSAKLSSDVFTTVFCVHDTNNDTNLLWMDLFNYIPIYQNCWLQYAKLYYNRTSRRTYSTNGVTVTPKGFGKLEPIAYLTPPLLNNPFSE